MQTTTYDVWLPVIFFKGNKKGLFTSWTSPGVRYESLKSPDVTCKNRSFLHKFLLNGVFSLLIVSIPKFSIVIGSLRPYLSRNQHAITWASNYNFCNLIPVIGNVLNVNYMSFSGFLSNVSYSLKTHDFSVQK